MNGVPFDAFLAGATRFEWCCLDCPRLYVTHAGALKHSIVHRHDYAGREDLANFDFGVDEVHPFVACTSGRDVNGNEPPKPGWPRAIVCGYCSLPRWTHNANQERLRPRLLAELRWTLRALRKQKALCLTAGTYGLPLVDTVSSGLAYLPP